MGSKFQVGSSLFALLLGALLIYANCSKVNFSNKPELSKSDGGLTPDSPTQDGDIPGVTCEQAQARPGRFMSYIESTATGNEATATCPSSSRVVGCAVSCASANEAGGSLIVGNGCQSRCSGNGSHRVTAFCYAGNSADVVSSSLENVPRDSEASCPASHPSIIGCAAYCTTDGLGITQGGTRIMSGRCRGECDLPGSATWITAYCGNFSPNDYGAFYQETTVISIASCPSSSKLSGGTGVCDLGKDMEYGPINEREMSSRCADATKKSRTMALCLCK